MNNASALTHAFPRRTRQTVAQQRYLRRRRNIAGILETALDPRYPLRHGLHLWPRIPVANRASIAEAFEQLVVMLRDPSITIPKRTVRDVMAFATHPASPAYGAYPAQAGFAAQALVDDVRAHSVDAAHV